MSDLFRMFGAIRTGLNQPVEDRRLAFDKVGGYTVSTVLSPDMGWETAIIDKNGTHPVERYENREHALAGHATWKRAVWACRTIQELGYGSLVDERVVTLVPDVEELPE